MDETFDEMVERIAKAYHESPCEQSGDDNHFNYCNPAHHNWVTAHPDDKRHARNQVAFVLREIGLDG